MRRVDESVRHGLLILTFRAVQEESRLINDSGFKRTGTVSLRTARATALRQSVHRAPHELISSLPSLLGCIALWAGVQLSRHVLGPEGGEEAIDYRCLLGLAI